MEIALILLLFITNVLTYELGTKQGCPESIDVKPCTCTNSPFTYLQCQHLDDVETLRKVFENSTKYKFKEVHIEYSTLQFLPHDIFGKVPVTDLYLKNVTLSKLFDGPFDNLYELDILHIENTKIISGIAWRLLEPFNHLRILNVYYNNIKVLGSDFSTYATKKLKQLTFYATETKSIKPGALQEFTNLYKVAVDNCKLTELTRNIFPVPFNGQVLYFNRNLLKSIPDDMFTDMPFLQTVGLKYNQLAVLPESAFHGSMAKVDYFQLEGNPIICDCRLTWLIKNKPPALTGVCYLPSKYHAKEIKNLNPEDFKC